MARPEITSRKVEETTTVESKKKGKGKTTRKRHPLPPRREGDAYTISELEPWKRSVPRSRLSASTLANKLSSLRTEARAPSRRSSNRRRTVSPGSCARMAATEHLLRLEIRCPYRRTNARILAT